MQFRQERMDFQIDENESYQIKIVMREKMVLTSTKVSWRILFFNTVIWIGQVTVHHYYPAQPSYHCKRFEIRIQIEDLYNKGFISRALPDKIGTPLWNST